MNPDHPDLPDVVTPEEALRAEPDLALLRDLLTAGWSWRPMLDEDNRPIRLDYWRRTGHYLDIVHIHDTGDAHAQRVRDDPHQRPGLVWRHAGQVGDTVRAVLALPEPDHPLAPHRTIGQPHHDI